MGLGLGYGCMDGGKWTAYILVGKNTIGKTGLDRYGLELHEEQRSLYSFVDA
jgi:hypothetical protein